jgi:hypothetical protein
MAKEPALQSVKVPSSNPSITRGGGGSGRREREQLMSTLDTLAFIR